MPRKSCHVTGLLPVFRVFSIHLAVQDAAPPIPQKMTLHSNIWWPAPGVFSR